MKTHEASKSNKVQLVEKNTYACQPQTNDDVTQINAVTDDKYLNIKQRGRKRKFENKDTGMNLENKLIPKKQHKSEKRPNASLRLNFSLGHFPQIDKSRTVRCKNDKCNKKTYVFCSICDVHLCLCVIENRNCFADFHNEKKKIPHAED